MTQIDSDSLADVTLTLHWQDLSARHREVYDAVKLNFWRDILPRDLYRKLMGKLPGDKVELSFEAGVPLVGYHPRSLFPIKRSQFTLRSDRNQNIPARLGRFYPKGVLRDVAGVFPQNKEPFRCVKVENGNLWVDFNHPLVGRPLSLDAEVRNVVPKSHERGGTSIDWIEVLSNGPGMQSRWRDQPTDFFHPGSLTRTDDGSDDRFYARPRFVQHVDANARKVITDLYGRLLPRRKRVLDLMSSWVSHLPDHLTFDYVAGLGLNAEELSKNTRLDDIVTHDLNHDPQLPFESESFDAVICALSVEYLTDPLAVFKDVARVLTPGGLFMVTFSNRWFAPKAIDIWSQLHDFERMGLVMEYFLRTEKFSDLNTLSRRGLPRDTEDKYFGQLPFSDPVYAVWGSKA